MSQSTVRIHPDVLREYSTQVLERTGMPRDAAARVAHSLVEAELRGVSSHGIMRLLPYVKKLRAGGTKANPNIRVIHEGPATAVVDGDHGMGQVVATYAMELAIQKAETYGVSMVVARNSEHFGAAAYYAMMAARKRMIGMVWSNTDPVMAAWGGKGAAIGNNPLAVAVPTKEEPPLVLDVSFSKVAGGKVRLAAKKGEKIPTDWIIDRNGFPTDDPNELPRGGALLPLGHKGYGLAIISEVFSGVLSGAGVLSGVIDWLGVPDKPAYVGHAMSAFKVECFMPLDEFKERVEKMRAELRSCPPGEGYDRVLVPGDIEFELAEKQKHGLDIPFEVYQDLCSLGDELGVDKSVLTD